jgi:hypothetical protein
MPGHLRTADSPIEMRHAGVRCMCRLCYHLTALCPASVSNPEPRGHMPDARPQAVPAANTSILYAEWDMVTYLTGQVATPIAPAPLAALCLYHAF